jgi:hypothetical protein
MYIRKIHLKVQEFNSQSSLSLIMGMIITNMTRGNAAEGPGHSSGSMEETEGQHFLIPCTTLFHLDFLLSF